MYITLNYGLTYQEAGFQDTGINLIKVATASDVAGLGSVFSYYATIEGTDGSFEQIEDSNISYSLTFGGWVVLDWSVSSNSPANYLSLSNGILSASEAGNTVTMATTSPNDFGVGTLINVIQGNGYGGIFTITSIISDTTFTYTDIATGLPTLSPSTSPDWGTVYIDTNADAAVAFPSGSGASVTLFVAGLGTGIDGVDLVQESTDGVRSWTDISLGAGGLGPSSAVYTLTVRTVGGVNYLLAGTDGGIWQYNLSTGAWTDLNGNLDVTQFNSISTDPKFARRDHGGHRGQRGRVNHRRAPVELRRSGDRQRHPGAIRSDPARTQSRLRAGE